MDVEKRKELLFEEAYLAIGTRNWVTFGQGIEAMHAIQTCNCVPVNHTKSRIKELVAMIESWPNDASDYFLNLTKGYLFFHGEKLTMAMDHLSSAIKLNRNASLPKVLRSQLPKEINPAAEADIRSAVLIESTARNNFVAAQFFSFSANAQDTHRSLLFVSDSIAKAPEALCPRSLRARLYIALENYDAALADLELALQFEPAGTRHIFLMRAKCQKELGRIDEALGTLKHGAENYPNDAELVSWIAILLEDIGQFEESIAYFERLQSLERANGKKVSKGSSGISRVREKHMHQVRSLSLQYFRNEEYGLALLQFEIIRKEGYHREYHALEEDKYLLSILWSFDPTIKIGEDSEISIRLQSLKEAARIKSQDGRALTAEESHVHNMIHYSPHYKIGFGPHKGMTVSEVIENDPDAFLTYVINLDHFLAADDIFMDRRIMNLQQYRHALEVNLNKGYLFNLWTKNGWREEQKAVSGRRWYEIEHSDFSNQEGWSHYNDNLDMDQQGLDFWDNL